MGVGEASRRFDAEGGAEYFAAQREIAEIAAELDAWKFESHLNATDAVIDFGCGTGALLDRLPGARKIGVEVNGLARQEAHQRGLETYASASDVPDQVANAVISNHALEHTRQPLAELHELRRILKPGGRLFLWLPIDDWRAQRRPSLGLDKDHHLYTWTPLLLANLLREVDYHVGTVRVVTSAWRYNYLRPARRLSPVAYRGLTFLTAVALRRRQLCAIARKPT
jgi:SAM-dependent methyltransferase